MLILLTLLACRPETNPPPTTPVALPIPQRGAVYACLGGPEEAMAGEDLDIVVTGTVIGFDSGADMNLAECWNDPSMTVDIEDANGDVWTLGWSVLDHSQADITPNLDLFEEDVVDLTFRWKLVWGTTAGFVLADDAGTIGAADEGTWGSALDAADLPGFEVARGTDLMALEETSCQPTHGFNVDFITPSETVSLLPVSTGTLEVDGQTLNVIAVDAMEHGPSDTCSTSDTTDITAWVAYR